jgi:mediator of replication checkpoint protein 1
MLSSQGSLFFPQFGELDAEQLLNQRSPAKSPVRPRRLVRKGDKTGIPPAPVFEDSSPEKQNVFEYLMGDKKSKQKDLPHNEFVQGEAEESDDELVIGFSKRTQGDEDEDAGIDPEEIAKLLDDKRMSKGEIREEAIIEKHK